MTDTSPLGLSDRVKNNPKLLGKLAALMILLSQVGMVAAGNGAVTQGP